MSLKQRLSNKAFELGFEDIGFTTADPLDLYIKEIGSRQHMYQWIADLGVDLQGGACLSKNHPWAKSMLVLILNYHKRRFPPQLIGKIGRVYQADDRQEMKDWFLNITSFLGFLGEEGIRFYLGEEIPARMSAARAGLAERSEGEGGRAAALKLQDHHLIVHDVVVTFVDASAVGAGAQGSLQSLRRWVRGYHVHRPS